MEMMLNNDEEKMVNNDEEETRLHCDEKRWTDERKRMERDKYNEVVVDRYLVVEREKPE